MKVLAITGGIACGKSTVARLFAAQGAQVRSADADARAVLEEPAVRAGVQAAFPEVVSADGDVDRAALAARIFADPGARAQLNALMHPAIRRRMRAAIDQARADPSPGLLLYEVPLLYEGGLETWFDAVIAVCAPRAVQSARLQEREAAAGRPPLTARALDERLAAQLAPEEKGRRADHVLPTDVPLEETRHQVEDLYRRLMA